MRVHVNSVILQDDVYVVVDVVGAAPFHVSDRVTHVLRGHEVVCVHYRSRWEIVNDPVVMILSLYRILKVGHILEL